MALARWRRAGRAEATRSPLSGERKSHRSLDRSRIRMQLIFYRKAPRGQRHVSGGAMVTRGKGQKLTAGTFGGPGAKNQPLVVDARKKDQKLTAGTFGGLAAARTRSPRNTRAHWRSAHHAPGFHPSPHQNRPSGRTIRSDGSSRRRRSGAPRAGDRVGCGQAWARSGLSQAATAWGATLLAHRRSRRRCARRRRFGPPGPGEPCRGRARVLGELPRRLEAAAAEHLYRLEEPIGGSHGSLCSGLLPAC